MTRALPLVRESQLESVRRGLARRLDVPVAQVQYDAERGVLSVNGEARAEVIPEDVFATSPDARERFTQYWRERPGFIPYTDLQGGVEIGGSITIQLGKNGYVASAFSGPIYPNRVVDDTVEGLQQRIGPIPLTEELLFSGMQVGGDDPESGAQARTEWLRFKELAVEMEGWRERMTAMGAWLKDFSRDLVQRGPEAVMDRFDPGDRPSRLTHARANAFIAEVFAPYGATWDSDREYVTQMEFSPAVQRVAGDLAQVTGVLTLNNFDARLESEAEARKLGFSALVRVEPDGFCFVLAAG